MIFSSREREREKRRRRRRFLIVPVQITFPSSDDISVMKCLLKIRCLNIIDIRLDALNITRNVFDALIDHLGVRRWLRHVSNRFFFLYFKLQIIVYLRLHT